MFAVKVRYEHRKLTEQNSDESKDQVRTSRQHQLGNKFFLKKNLTGIKVWVTVILLKGDLSMFQPVSRLYSYLRSISDRLTCVQYALPTKVRNYCISSPDITTLVQTIKDVIAYGLRTASRRSLRSQPLHESS
ncbi:hypothetical protein ElyMa_002936600 [Elysia marginata]|uniref:Uncharacterized protein n=1 Tax=Elysia marginata TaxID=1093978 RepID=A0AAV4I4U6_9GAST|nr:hypothetical protein ElyMa_002936600 [Elysia marginata]